MTGAPAVVVLRPHLWTSLDAATECVAFTVRAPTPIPKMSIATAGLGDARLAPESAVHDLDCAKSWAKGAALVAESNVSLAGSEFRLIMHGSAFPHPGTPVQGALLLVVPGRAPTSIPLALQTDGPADITRAAFWFLGVAIPGVLTALIAYVGVRRQKVSESNLMAKMEFENYKRATAPRLTESFSTHLPGIWPADDPKFCTELRAELERLGVFDKLPNRPRAALIQALDAADRRRSLRDLRRAFPEWRGAIERATSTT